MSPRPASEVETRLDLLGLPLPKLTEALGPGLDHSYRARQVYRALYERDAGDFAEMTDLPLDLRRNLSDRFVIGLPEITARHRSADGTEKLLLRLADAATIETVDIPDGKRHTLCVSSQAGCALACRFCVTGFWGAGRNLSAGEIVGQVLAGRRRAQSEDRGLNLVFMGMGEPLLNLDNLRDALEILMQQISWRRITVSTAGIVPGIDAMARWPHRPQLAISLHAPDDERRSRLMPINRRYPLRELLAALRRYPLAGKQKLTFEYILIRGRNDALEDADTLARLLLGLRAKVNLIPLNSDPVLEADMQPPAPAAVDAFHRRLLQRGLLATVRKRRGDDVSAACGQLRARGGEARGFRRSNLSF